MSDRILEILLLVVLWIVNGFFAMAEIAIVSSRKARLEQMADEGNTSARIALALANDPTPFLSTIQIGITLISILVGFISSETLGEPIATALRLIHGFEP